MDAAHAAPQASARDLSSFGAGVNTLKALIGIGLLSLPYATQQVGCVASVVGMGVIAALTFGGIVFAAEAGERLAKRWIDTGRSLRRIEAEDRSGGQSDGLGAEDAPFVSKEQQPGTSAGSHFGLGPFDEAVQEVLGWPGQLAWVSSVLAAQFGCAVSYICLVVQIVQRSWPQTDRLFATLGLGSVLAVLCTVPKLRGVTVFSVTSLLTYAIILGILVRHCVSGTGGHVLADTLDAAAVPLGVPTGHQFATWFGLVSFSFSSLPVSMSIHRDMREPARFQRVTACAFASCWIVDAFTGVVGCLAFGEQTAEVVLLNFEEGMLTDCAEVIVCIVLTLTYVLQMMPVFNCAQAACGVSHNYVLVRMAILALSVVVAYVAPNPLVIMSLTGSVAYAVSGFVLPPLVFLMASPEPTALEIFAAVGMFAIGTASASLAICGAM